MEIPTDIMQEAEKVADNFMELDCDELSWLAELHQYLSRHKTDYEAINDKILPLFYKLGIFVGPTGFSFWQAGFEWAESKETEDKYQKLDLKTTLALLTAALQGGEPYGADYWYSKGVTQELIAQLVKLRENEPKPKPFEFVKTGFINLDKATGGLRKGGITVIGSRPAMGVISFAADIADNIMIKEDRSDAVLLFTDSRSTEKFIRGRCEIIMVERFSKTSIFEIMQAEAGKHGAKLLIWETTILAPRFFRDMRKIAVKLNIPIIILMHLPYYLNSVDKKPCPALDEFYIVEEQLSCIDTVIALHRPSFYYTEDEMEYGKSYGSETELAVLKAANGETGIVEIKFDIDTLKFIN